MSAGNPPDPSLAVGYAEVIVTTNTVIDIFAKSGARLSERPLADFFAAAQRYEAVWDPRAFFDQRSSRYFLAATGGFPSATRTCVPETCVDDYLLAVSKTATPTSLTGADWYFYTFDGTRIGGVRTAVDSDWTIVSANDDTLVLTAYQATADNQRLLPAKIWFFDKAALVRGEPVSGPTAELTDAHDPSGISLTRVVPAQMFGPAPLLFMVGQGIEDPSNGPADPRPKTTCLVILGVSGGPREAHVEARDSGVRDCADATFAPQRGYATPLFAAAVLSSPPVYRDGYLWVALRVPHQYPSGVVAAVRLLQIDVRAWPAQPTIVSDVTLSEEAVWYWFPSLVVSAAHDVAITVARSSSDEYPSAYYTGRLSQDPEATLRPPAPLRVGTSAVALPAPQYGSRFVRWGDFFGAALDPGDGTAWFVAEYGGEPCRWSTWIGNVDWRSNSVAPTAAAPTITVSVPPCH